MLIAFASRHSGRILGVNFLLMGSYFELLGKVRMDSRLVRVETGEVVRSEGVSGNSDDWFGMERQVAVKIIQGLDSRMDESERKTLKGGEGVDLKRMMAFANALDMYDNGDRKAAVVTMEEIVRMAPTFPQAEQSLLRMRRSP